MAINGMATHDFPKKEEEIQERVKKKKNHGYSLLELRDSVLVKFLPRETRANCGHYNETLVTCLHQVHP
jgi:hypothetical protein